MPEHAYLAAAVLVFVFFIAHVAVKNRAVLRESIAVKFGNLDLVERLTEEKSRAEEARATAERATATKDQFLAAASHDIRQPIHAALMFLGALESDATPAVVQRTNGLRTSLVAAGQMLDTLLDVAKIDAGVLERADVPCQAAALAARVTAIMEPVAKRRGLDLRVHAPRDLWFEADPVLCQRILLNLMSNALKYTRRGAVLLSFRRARGRCRIQIWDTGIGIPTTELERIFDDFCQLDNLERDRARGIGLGLSITKRLARVLETRIEVRSVVGRGSVFGFDLPLTTPSHEVSSAPRSVDVDGPLGHVLVVDDDELSRVGLSALLDAWGYEVQSARDVEGARRLAARSPTLQLAIVDFRLPKEKTGHDAVVAIQEALGRKVAVLVITGDMSPERIRDASARGHRVLFKPIAPDVLREAIRATAVPSAVA